MHLPDDVYCCNVLPPSTIHSASTDSVIVQEVRVVFGGLGERPRLVLMDATGASVCEHLLPPRIKMHALD